MKILFSSITYIWILYSLISCGNRNDSIEVIINAKDIKYTSLYLDTVYIYMDIEACSYNGDSGVDGDCLYFIDHFFGFLYEISPSGVVLHRYLGLGNGPNEIFFRPQLGATVVNNDLLIMGGTFDAYLFKSFINREKIYLRVSETINSLNDAGAYTFYPTILRKVGNKFFYNIYSDSDYCNPCVHSRDYFSKAHIIMEVDLKNGAQRPIGKYSQYYNDNHYKVNHLFQICYDIDTLNNFYISYQADSLIHIYNKKFNQTKVFGFQGSNMNTHYSKALPNFDDFNRVWTDDHADKGYYTWLEYIDETNMTFRSYQKGAHTEFDGLQIYQGDILIADVEVPKQFKVAGYIPPYYISQIICDEEAETMKFYKFRLD